MNLLARVVLTLILVGIFRAAEAHDPSAHAYEVEAGAVMICDTQKQVERLGQLFDGNLQIAINTINGEENDPRACGMADVAYVRGEPIGTVRGKSRTFHVVPIIVLAVNSPDGYQPFRATFFSLSEVDEYSA